MFKQAMIEFWQDESGLTAVEYAIAGGLVVGGMVGAFVTLGTNATARITELGNATATPIPDPTL
ncbi:Flp family type IVb pilin [Ferrimonas gelatinilytica]|uniref:Flp family type IVb pilin n=1 Tax=Ferrimonas gelatinilytica TaxID=1255257 RepID=A0ABP9S0J6_9GAMM